MPGQANLSNQALTNSQIRSQGQAQGVLDNNAAFQQSTNSNNFINGPSVPT
jgi:hypothetical protein